MSLNIASGKRVIRIGERHVRYWAFLHEHFDIYFNAVETTGEENGYAIVDFSEPAVHQYRHNGMLFKLSCLPEEPEIVADYFRHAQGSRLAFDIGAYCGLSTYELSKRYDTVVAFEPDPHNLECLVHNLVRHQITNVIVAPFAILAKTGPADFLTEGGNGSSAWLAGRVAGPVTTVSGLSLADACSQYGIPDLITMDIELSEVDVLEASRDLLTREHISIAIDTFHGNPPTVQPVENILRDCGYQVETNYIDNFPTTYGWKEPA